MNTGVENFLWHFRFYLISAVFVSVVVIFAVWQHQQSQRALQAEADRQTKNQIIQQAESNRVAQIKQEQLQKQQDATAQKAASNAAAAAQKAASEAAATAQKAAKEAADAHAEFLTRYTNTNFTRNPGIKMAAVAVAGENGTMNHAIGAALVNRFKGERLDLNDSFFKPALVSDGLFNDAFNGASDLFNKLELAKSLDALLLGRQDVQYSTNAALENIVTANMHLEMVVLPVAGQIQSQDWKFMATGAGTGPAEARQQAEERVIKQISTDTNMSFLQIY
jgi:hypothetical protein